MKLTNHQISVMREYGEAWLYYIRRSPMLTGGETAEDAAQVMAADKRRGEMQAAVTALCNMLNVSHVITMIFSGDNHKQQLELRNRATGETVLTIDELGQP